MALYTKCIPKLFAGNERSEFPEKGGDLRGGYYCALTSELVLLELLIKLLFKT